jgi:hypothetical protein
MGTIVARGATAPFTPAPFTPALGREPGPGVVDQVLAHGLSGRGVEVRSAGKVGHGSASVLANRPQQAEIRLVHQGRGGEGVAGPLLMHGLLRCCAELGVNQWQKLIGGGSLAGFGPLKQHRHRDVLLWHIVT